MLPERNIDIRVSENFQIHKFWKKSSGRKIAITTDIELKVKISKSLYTCVFENHAYASTTYKDLMLSFLGEAETLFWVKIGADPNDFHINREFRANVCFFYNS